ncbi:hypothetical protein H6F74_03345 [Trichocoleus sp. FACHB-90]|jgi:hypothetical protein|uniref:Uncharacterized protein n=1 Tax=Funiculus sociatus GB2-A5 TaxID=2933946 RepID=A0ABV0JQ95_9CYAN|nr:MULTISPECIES: hypothetical protein [unclassified Trichocoleus]MBD1834187.1 hypothetical protein [Cyanobacteria bacterium FACHB-472]MBD1907945.1 hypothetical protein [Trichocoleus sp. FACHB-832]MBD1925324.1 hypothetical protein [Trichocoleus sp. FACHB-90]MBD2004267.1 hypothetical protein [Trichocoleus sp. FACHB-40]MBD2064803.1 hypothetical protein [Trichocoleus sp. FACHB-6]
MSPLYPDEEDQDDFRLIPPHRRETTWTGKLRKFHSQFDSSIRAKFRDCLFREIEEGGVVTFQILCPNEAVQKRLIQKKQKIGNTVRWIWLQKIDRLAICVDNGGLQCQVFSLQKYLIE